VFVTRNSEYHCRDSICVAVRDRKTGQFRPDHPAIGRHMSGAIHFENGNIESFSLPGEPVKTGDTLFFTEGRVDTELHTSPLCDVERPAKEVIRRYGS
jgi:hypothetical protein